MLDPVPKITVDLRRYPSGNARQPCPLMPGEYSYHNAQVFFALLDCPLREPGADEDWTELLKAFRPPNEDPRWPRKCGCGFAFADSDEWQMFANRLYSRGDNGELVSLRNAPPGAMWWADWLPKNFWWDNKDDYDLMVMLPNGHEWDIDSRASNCTMPNDREHRCWVRHGEPPNIHVDKNGRTCAAGAGSILAGNYHGFLHHGELT